MGGGAAAGMGGGQTKGAQSEYTAGRREKLRSVFETLLRVAHGLVKVKASTSLVSVRAMVVLAVRVIHAQF